MIDLKGLFDPYSRQARLYPALLTLLPLLLTLLAWVPALVTIGQLIVGIAVACGALFFLSDLARTAGKRLEPSLLLEWGGWPTTVWLRHSDKHLPAEVKRRYHVFLSRCPGAASMPTEDEEQRDPASSDEHYAASVMWLKEQCRGADFALVQKENATYGFRRNLLGLKPVGVAICSIVLAVPLLTALARPGASVAHLFQILPEAYVTLPLPVLGALAVSAIGLAAWLLTVRRSWVREAGDLYARALLASCDVLVAPASSGSISR